MKPFSYSRIDDAADAVKQGTAPQTRFLAGGTNLVDYMKLEVLTPTRVVDINHLPLDQITENGKGLRIGAMVRNSDLAYHQLVQERYPVLSQALLSGATAQIRNMATVGGNLLQRTRCTYFRDLAWQACNKRQPGSGCSAIDGCNRSHAILGTSDQCIATHPSDMCVAFVALDALIFVTGPAGQRQIRSTEFFVPYGEDPARETVLQPGELITHVDLPDAALFKRSHYLKVRDRSSFEFALASAAVALDLQDGKIQTARVAFGGIGTKPWRSAEAEQALTGQKADQGTFAEAAKAALKNAQPQKQNAFKVELAKRTLIRALQTVSEM